MSATLLPLVRYRAVDADGNPLAGAKLNFYEAGTSTRLDTYSDTDLSTANANPVVADAGGLFGAIYLQNAAYKVVLTDADDAVIWTQDNVPAIPATAINVDVDGTAGEALDAGDSAYLSDGSGAKTSGRWYKTDADEVYSSVQAGMIGLVPVAIAVGESGKIRLAGRITGLAGLVAGSRYYVSATAGALTATAPTRARFVGVADSTTSLVLAASSVREPQASVDIARCDGRLTLTTGVPVTTADVTAAGTIYFTPYAGNRLALYDGTRWNSYVFTELSLALSVTSGKNYDVFVYDNAGTLTLETVEWTSDSARATALATQDGVLVKTGATGRRYLGTIRASGTNTTEDSLAKRLVWNYYHRAVTPLRVLEATNTWTYTTATLRQANGAAGNQVEVVVGVAEDAIDVRVQALVENNGSAVLAVVAIGEDSTTAAAAGCLMQNMEIIAAFANAAMPVSASLAKVPAAGYHLYAWLEYSSAVGTTTWHGDNGAATITQTGIFALWRR